MNSDAKKVIGIAQAYADEVGTESKAYTDEIFESVKDGLKYQGSVATEEDLPTPSTSIKGHFYTVLENGHEWLCDGTEWVDLSADLDNKVDKEDGKGLSANDFTDEDKAKLDELENYDDTDVKERLSDIEGKENGWDAKAEVSDIPTTLAELTGDATHRVVTDTEKSTWSGKQNAISDLETIRSGAELGSTALQEVPNTYRTSAEQDVIDEGKVDKETGKGLIDEAPSDHERYVRKDGAWVKFAEPKIETFEDIQKLCRKGIARDYLQIGQPFKFKRDSTDIEVLVMGFIENNKTGSIKIKDNTLKEGVIFQTNDCIYSLQFDEREAFYYAPDGLSAGPYSFVLGEHSWYSADVGKTFYFTLQNDVPAGGQLVWKQAYNVTLEGGGIDVFDSGNDFTANETATMSSTEISGATSLGTIRNSFSGNFNSCQRALLGNNRWKESAMRQHLNSNAAAGSVWTPQNHWDRPPSWRTSTKGFMNGLNADLTDYIAEVEIDTYRNTVCDGGGLDTTEDKIFLVGNKEIYCPAEGSDNGEPWDFYKNNSQFDAPSGNADPCRIKKVGASAAYWWWRSPHGGTAHHVRIAFPSGEWSTNVAFTSNGVAPAFIIA